MALGTIASDTIQDGAGNSTATTNCIKGSAKAWVSYNGVTQTIGASFNISSITRNAAGFYTLNFTIAMPSVNYATQVTGSNISADGRLGSVDNTYVTNGQSTTQVGIATQNPSTGTRIDVSVIGVSIFSV